MLLSIVVADLNESHFPLHLKVNKKRLLQTQSINSATKLQTAWNGHYRSVAKPLLEASSCMVLQENYSKIALPFCNIIIVVVVVDQR